MLDIIYSHLTLLRQPCTRRYGARKLQPVRLEIHPVRDQISHSLAIGITFIDPSVILPARLWWEERPALGGTKDPLQNDEGMLLINYPPTN